MVLRVEAYLRIACSVLGFEIGELWSARSVPGEGPSLKFIQLFTSPTYEEFHKSLLNTDGGSSSENSAQRHRFSPIVCRGVCDGGQIVWANTRISNGFIGCTDLPLNTAVGLPVCSIGEDLCIIILYSVPIMPISPNAVEFLCSITRAASEGDGGLLPNVSAPTATPISAPMTEQFVGVWDMAVFVSKYAKDVDFQLLPLNQLQGYIDFQERVAFKELFEDFKQKRDGRFTAKQINSLRHSARNSMDDISSIASSEISPTNSIDDEDGPGAFMVDLDPFVDTYCGSESGEDSTTRDSRSSSRSLSNNTPDWYSCLKSGEELARTSSGGLGSPGAAASISTSELINSAMNSSFCAGIDARKSYKKHRERFHEFIVAVLGMTIFDAAELWLLSERTKRLNVVAALHRDGDMQMWTYQSKDVSLAKNQDVPGRVLTTDYPIWDHSYDSHTDDLRNYPRANAAAAIGVRTAFGVPLAGPAGAVGVLMMYSKREVDTAPLVVTLVLKSAQLLSACALGLDPLTKLDIENIIHAPKGTMFDCTSDRNEEKKRRAMRRQREQNNSLMSMSMMADSVEAVDVSGSRDDSDAHYSSANLEIPEHLSGLTLLTLEGGSQTSSCKSNASDEFNEGRIPRARGIARWHSTHMRMPGSEGTTPRNLDPPYQSPFHSTPSSHSHPYMESNISTEESYRNHNAHRPMRPTWSRLPQMAQSQGVHNVAAASMLGHTGYWSQQTHGAHVNVGMNSMGVDTSRYMQQQGRQQNIPHPLPDYMSRGGVSGRNDTGGFIRSTLPYQQNPEESEAVPAAFSDDHLGKRPYPYHSEPMSGGQDVNSTYGHHQSPFGEKSPRYHMNESDVVNSAPVIQYERESSDSKDFPLKPVEEENENDIFCHEIKDGDSSRMCKLEGCTSLSSKRSPYCIAHIGTRRCQFEDCSKCAQGNTKYCIAHGGGRRCTFPGCSKGARDRFFCAAHGGGKRCKIQGCSKSAVGGSKLCTAHGGGKRCQTPGCSKSAQSSTSFCVRHGGGRKCHVNGCTKVSRGKTEYCAAHGGGIKCRAEDCIKAAAGKYFYCKEHLRIMDTTIENLDDIEDDEEFSGVMSAGSHMIEDGRDMRQFESDNEPRSE